jgi:hypothetical protein
MANEFRTLDSHSAEYFGETRDYWWNSDFLELMGRRLAFDRVQDVLDVGCGTGHWGQLLAHVLPRTARVQALTATRSGSRRRTHGLRVILPTASAIRFLSPKAAVRRGPASTSLLPNRPDPCPIQVPWSAKWSVLRAGGSGNLVEPNNIANSLILDSLNCPRSGG